MKKSFAKCLMVCLVLALELALANKAYAQQPFVTFLNSDFTIISETDSQGVAIKIAQLQSGVNEDGEAGWGLSLGQGTVRINFTSGDAVYGTDFTTIPALDDGSIILNFTGNESITAFTVVAVHDPNFTGTKHVSFTISDVTGDIQKWFNSGGLQHWLTIRDNETNASNLIEWTRLESPVNEQLSSVIFFSEDLGYVAGRSVILKTIDGGLHWKTLKPNPLKLYDRITAYFLDEEHGFMGAWEYDCPEEECDFTNKFFTTTDGGATWSAVSEFAYVQVISAIRFVSPTTGFVVAQGKLLKTLDGGKTWRSTTPKPVYDISFTACGVGYAGFGIGSLLKSLDAGNSWSPVITNPEHLWIGRMSITRSNEFFAFGFLNANNPPGCKKVYRSADGRAWSEVGDCMPDGFLAFSPDGHFGVSVSYDPLNYWQPFIYASSNYGSAWQLQSLPEEYRGHELLNAAIPSDRVVYAVGGHGLILKGTIK